MTQIVFFFSYGEIGHSYDVTQPDKGIQYLIYTK